MPACLDLEPLRPAGRLAALERTSPTPTVPSGAANPATSSRRPTGALSSYDAGPLTAGPGHPYFVWPSRRNAPCWCGSGRRYKTCCGSALMVTGVTEAVSSKRCHRSGPPVVTCRTPGL